MLISERIYNLLKEKNISQIDLLLGAESRNQKKNRNLYTRGKKIEFCHIDKALFLPRHIAYTISQIRCARA